MGPHGAGGAGYLAPGMLSALAGWPFGPGSMLPFGSLPMHMAAAQQLGMPAPAAPAPQPTMPAPAPDPHQTPVQAADPTSGITPVLTRLTNALSTLNNQLAAPQPAAAAQAPAHNAPAGMNMNQAGSNSSFALQHLKYIVPLDTATMTMSQAYARRYYQWEAAQAASSSAPASQAASPRAGAQAATSQLSVLDLPKDHARYKAFIKAHRFFKQITEAFAKQRYPEDAAKQAMITSASLLRIESQLVAQIVTAHVNTLGSSVDAESLGGMLTSQRKLFYYIGRCFAVQAADVVLSDLSCSYKGDNPIPLSLSNTLKQQLNLARAVEGVKATPAGERGCSKVPSAALLATELAHLLNKEVGELQDALLRGTRAGAVANLARLRAVLAATSVFGGRTSDTLYHRLTSVWVNMQRTVVPPNGAPPRIVPVRVPVVVLALAGAQVLYAYMSQPGLVLTSQVYRSKVKHAYELRRLYAKPPGAHYLCAGYLLARAFMTMLLLTPESLDPKSNPYGLVVRVNPAADMGVTKVRSRSQLSARMPLSPPCDKSVSL